MWRNIKENIFVSFLSDVSSSRWHVSHRLVLRLCTQTHWGVYQVQSWSLADTSSGWTKTLNQINKQIHSYHSDPQLLNELIPLSCDWFPAIPLNDPQESVVADMSSEVDSSMILGSQYVNWSKRRCKMLYRSWKVNADCAELGLIFITRVQNSLPSWRLQASKLFLPCGIRTKVSDSKHLTFGRFARSEYYSESFCCGYKSLCARPKTQTSIFKPSEARRS